MNTKAVKDGEGWRDSESESARPPTATHARASPSSDHIIHPRALTRSLTRACVSLLAPLRARCCSSLSREQLALVSSRRWTPPAHLGAALLLLLRWARASRAASPPPSSARGASLVASAACGASGRIGMRVTRPCASTSARHRQQQQQRRMRRVVGVVVVVVAVQCQVQHQALATSWLSWRSRPRMWRRAPPR